MDTDLSPPNLTPVPEPTPAEQLTTRLLAALAAIYQQLDGKSLPWGVKPTLDLLRPRLETSLEADPRRAAFILTWIWARIPSVIGDVIDLTDQALVLAIADKVEEVEGWRSS